jgi:hypothetical protein
MPQRRSNQTRRRRRGGVLNSAKRRGAVWVEAAGAVCEVIAGVVKRCFSKKKNNNNNNNNNNNRNYNYMNGYGPSNASFTAPKQSYPKKDNGQRRSLRLARKLNP